jgi:hypothetical protein
MEMDGQSMPKGKQPQLFLMEVAIIDPGVAALYVDGTPYDFYSAIIDDAVINRKVDQTNIYATQNLLDGSDVPPNS